MPKPGEHTQIDDIEAMDWVQRMLRKHPEIEATTDMRSWFRFVERWMLEERGYRPTVAQLFRTWRGVEVLYEKLPQINIRFEPVISRIGKPWRFRDLRTGIFLRPATVLERLQMLR